MLQAARRLLGPTLGRLARMVGLPRERKEFEPGELDALLSHLAYEWLMFGAMRNLWKQTQQPHILECLLLHARALREFLFDTQEGYPARYLDNALFATDYVPDWVAEKGKHTYQVLWDTKEAIDAQLSHLSRGRSRSEATETLDEGAIEIADALDLAWQSFSKALGASTWHPAFQRALIEQRLKLGLS